MTNSQPGYGSPKLKRTASDRAKEEEIFNEKVLQFLRFMDKDPECEISRIHVQELGVFRIDYGAVRNNKSHDMQILVPFGLSNWKERIERLILKHGNQNLGFWMSNSEVLIFRIDKIVNRCQELYREYQAGKLK